jgi:outer membrane protein assembly factor BamB
MNSCISAPPEDPRPLNLQIIWKTSTNNIDAPDVQPLIVDDAKIIISGQQDLVAVNINTGDELWRGAIGDEEALVSALLLYDEKRKRILSNHKEDFKAWDSITGELLFTLTGESGVQTFALGKHVVLEDGYGLIGDTLDAYVIKPNGSIRYTIQVPFASAGLAYSENTLYMTMGKTINGGLTKGKIVAFNVQSGDSLWAYNTNDGGFISIAPVIENNILYASTFGNSTLDEAVALDTQTGEVIWRYASDKLFTRRTAMGPTHFYINTGGSLVALDKKGGNLAWRVEWLGTASTKPVYLRGYVYLTDYGEIKVIDDETGEVVHREPTPDGSPIWHVAASSDKIFAQTSRQLIAYQPWHLRGE